MRASRRFEKGHPRYGGRKPSIKTQLKRFEENHPDAYDALMEILYEKGLEGSSIDAQYVIDRLKGKAKATTALEVSGLEQLGVATVREIFRIARGEQLEGSQKLLEEGSQSATEQRGSQGIHEEAEG